MAAAPDGTLWLHGGKFGDVLQGDLWRFDGTQWERISPVGAAPSARHEHVGAWDRERGRFVIGLGERKSGEVFDDVWAFDPEDGAWTQIAEGGPAARYGSCAVIDDQGRMVITHGFASTVRFDDTWAFDLVSDSWTDISPPEGSRPPVRCLHACTYDSAAQELTMFGGRQSGNPFLGDTWTLAENGWTEVLGEGPEARVRSRGLLIGREMHVVGGTGADGLLGNAWIFTDEVWQPAASGAPAARESAAVAQVDDGAWLFGGNGPDGPLDDLWFFG